MPTDRIYELAGKRVWVAGHRGMVGSALVRRLADARCELLLADRTMLDLQCQAAVNRWMDENRPEVIFLAAAKVGGILANDTYPAEFLAENLLIQSNIIGTANRIGVEKLIFLGSSCIYPKFAAQPITEDALLTGPLEPTNEWYAIAKIAGIKLVEAHRKQYGRDYISAMPTNLYGPEDNFDLASSHVLPALIRKAHEAKQRGDAELVIWGTGSPRREFLHVDDCADAIVFLAEHYSGDCHVNVGSGDDISIRDLAALVARVIGYKGQIVCDETKPDGTPRKLMSADKLRTLGWTPQIDLENGIRSTVEWYMGVYGGQRASRGSALSDPPRKSL